TALTGCVCPRRVKARLPLRVNHPWMVLSAVAAARIRLSGPVKASPDTPAWAAVCSLKHGWAVAASHTRTSPVGLPAATHLPSALNATLVHGTYRSVGRLKKVTGCRVAASQAATPPPWSAVARYLPSGL